MSTTRVANPADQAVLEESYEEITTHTPDLFQKELEKAGIGVTPLTVEEENASFFQRWLGGFRRQPLYRITWPRKRQIRLLGKCAFSWEGQAGGWFGKATTDMVKMPIEAELRSATVKNLPQVAETAVFVEVRRDPILAVKVAGQWLEVYRWL